MSVRMADCKRTDGRTQAPDISCGCLDFSLVGVLTLMLLVANLANTK